MSERKTIDDLIQAGVDGQLDPDEQAMLDRVLAENPERARQFADLQTLSGLIGQGVPDPSSDRLQTIYQQASAPVTPLWRIAATIAVFCVGLGAGYMVPRSGDTEPLALAAFAEHSRAAHALYVSEVLHPVEVAATEKDHLQVWLSNRLGAPVIAPRLGASGISLIGGRLLPAGDRASALFMYENATGDRISLMATHGAPEADQSFRFAETDGVLTIFWQDGPWQYSLVGTLERTHLGDIARDIHGQLI